MRASTYFPVLRDYSEKTFGGDFETPADYLDPFIRERITQGGNWAIYAPNPYGPQNAQLLRQGAEVRRRPRATTSSARTTAGATCWHS